jgi:hypothetical protein
MAPAAAEKEPLGQGSVLMLTEYEPADAGVQLDDPVDAA